MSKKIQQRKINLHFQRFTFKIKVQITAKFAQDLHRK